MTRMMMMMMMQHQVKWCVCSWDGLDDDDGEMRPYYHIPVFFFISFFFFILSLSLYNDRGLYRATVFLPLAQ